MENTTKPLVVSKLESFLNHLPKEMVLAMNFANNTVLQRSYLMESGGYYEVAHLLTPISYIVTSRYEDRSQINHLQQAKNMANIFLSLVEKKVVMPDHLLTLPVVMPLALLPKYEEGEGGFSVQVQEDGTGKAAPFFSLPAESPKTYTKEEVDEMGHREMFILYPFESVEAIDYRYSHDYKRSNAVIMNEFSETTWFIDEGELAKNVFSIYDKNFDI